MQPEQKKKPLQTAFTFKSNMMSGSPNYQSFGNTNACSASLRVRCNVASQTLLLSFSDNRRD